MTEITQERAVENLVENQTRNYKNRFAIALLGGLSFLLTTSPIFTGRAFAQEESIKEHVDNINTEIIDQPDRVAELAQKVAFIATREFCKELSCDPGTFTHIFLEDNNKFEEEYKKSTGCSDKTAKNASAFADILNSRAYYRISDMLYEDRSNESYWQNPGNLIYGTVFHELGHLYPEPKPGTREIKYFDPRNEEMVEVTVKDGELDPKTGEIIFFEFTKGLVPHIAGNPASSYNGRVCLEPLSRLHDLAEEVISESQARKNMRKNGLDTKEVAESSGYSPYIIGYDYQLARLFNGDMDALRKAQRESDPYEFFRLIGERAGALDKDQISVGQREFNWRIYWVFLVGEQD